MEKFHTDLKKKESPDSLFFIRKLKELNKLYGLIEGENIVFWVIKHRRIDLLLEIINDFHTIQLLNTGTTDIINYCIDYNLPEYIEVILSVIKKNEKLENYKDANGRNYYMNAVILNRISIFQSLIDYSTPNYSETESQGYTILHIACFYNYKTIISLIRNTHGKSFYLNSNGNTPLHIAIVKSNVESVIELLKFQDISRSMTHSNKDGHKPVELNNGIKGLKIQNIVLTKELNNQKNKQHQQQPDKNKQQPNELSKICNKVRNKEILNDNERKKLKTLREEKKFNGNNQELCKKYTNHPKKEETYSETSKKKKKFNKK